MLAGEAVGELADETDSVRRAELEARLSALAASRYLAGEFFLLLFDGNLLAQGPSSQAMQRLTQAENDFTPLLTGLQALSDQDSASALSFVHLPASYGAWMTAALK